MKIMRVGAMFIGLLTAGALATVAAAGMNGHQPGAIATSHGQSIGAPGIIVAQHTDAERSIYSPATGPDATGAPVQLAQTQRLQTRQAPGGRVLQTRRVPAGQTMYLRQEGQRQFSRFRGGATLPDVDCIEVNCPASFPANATCWQCRPQIKAQDSGDED